MLFNIFAMLKLIVDIGAKIVEPHYEVPLLFHNRSDLTEHRHTSISWLS